MTHIPKLPMSRRQVVVGASAMTLIAAGFSRAVAQSYPTQNISLIVPFTPGGSTDILARLLGQKLEIALKFPVIIESRPGAGGTVGVASVARAPADGYTLVMGHIGTFGVAPALYPKLSYDPLTSFEPVSGIAQVHNMLVVHPDVPVKTLQELIQYAKQKPGELNYASGGNGSAAHIAMVALADQAGIKLTHVPYKGTAPAVTDLLGGRVQLTFTGAPNLIQHVEAGKMRALAVSGANRLKAAPTVPTVAESGFPGFEASQWYGIMVPAGTPKEIVTLLNKEIVTAMAGDEIKERLSTEGADVWTNTPDEFRAHIGTEIERWGALVKRAGIRLE
ncbi:tripartite tricarboxylate transporter substrate binding protein [Agrobacterium vitis]|uniref:Bug family tripartite tricarboxylate transporter substrate binding protein n=1 Tax=Rhizobium/Agrobacterium group TaxID=227290 RepID=UPI0012E7E095|nr:MULTISPECIES: tripartite tricarboxylate transporter substrate binding protein [Rhizobium/Agrobacterium group]MCF1495753.1 tripartite tricarboxylate transporter substrate binding protein [Allorhizobium ampelinum]MVA45812.1 tripartite tricarboxylate transporter substrate binding protein [Agrobacterium vitis]